MGKRTLACLELIEGGEEEQVGDPTFGDLPRRLDEILQTRLPVAGSSRGVDDEQDAKIAHPVAKDTLVHLVQWVW